MADIVNTATRSRMMSNIRGRDTKPEIQLRRALHRAGFRFRKNDRRLPGTPDIVLPKWNAVVLVHGCFWHRHSGCRLTSTPTTRKEFWAQKFAATVRRDGRNRADLAALGWRQAVVWECSMRSLSPEVVADLVADWLKSEAKVCIIGNSHSEITVET